jgi:uncharacterized protein
MISYLKKEKWSPYLVGFFIALIGVGSFFLFHKTIGTSTSFVKLAALLWSLIDPMHIQQSSYYQEYLKNKAWIDFQMMLVLGIFIGAYLSYNLSKKSIPLVKSDFSRKTNIKKSSYSKYIAPFIGGIIVMFGARFAGGCTSGHAISGGFQLALSGWLFMLGVFALGIPTALIFYRKKT